MIRFVSIVVSDRPHPLLAEISPKDRAVSLHIVNWLFHHDRDRHSITVIFVRNAFV